MTKRNTSITRRSFLSLPAAVPFAPRFDAERNEHWFRYEGVLGTSLDLVVRTSDAAAAQTAERAVLDEIQRLAGILSTRDPESEISRLAIGARPRSRALGDVLDAYAEWQQRTSGAISLHPQGLDTPRNVDALGKAYILDRALDAACLAAPKAAGILLNIGGDIAAAGEPFEVGIADPLDPFDNAEPVTVVSLENAAIATSGPYARGAHLIDPHTGAPLATAPSATVIAEDALTANALATALCIMGAERGIPLVESTPRAEAIVIERTGAARRSSGFSRFERPQPTRIRTAAAWPNGYRLTMSLALTDRTASGARGRGPQFKRHFVAIWAETPMAPARVVRVIAFWADQERYYGELSIFFNRAGGKADRIASFARATRNPGAYDLVWDGLDDKKSPALADAYKIIVETNQEGGSYAKQSGTIVCGENPAEIRLASTANFEAITVQYGPRKEPA